MLSLPLHPKIFDNIMYVILPAIAVLQWLIVIPVVQRKKLWGALAKIGSIHAVDKKIAFMDDGFFFLWNISPIFFLGVYYYTASNWQNWVADLILLNRNDLVLCYNKLYFLRFHEVVLLLCVTISIVAVCYQIWKQHQFKKYNTFVYWWDIRISKIIYITRLFALFYNMFLFFYILLFVFHMGIFLVQVVNLSQLNLMFFHPDNAGGLGVIGEISIVLSSILLFISGIGITAIFDHKHTQGIVHTMSDIMSLICIVPACFILMYPTIVNSRSLTNAFTPLNIEAEQLLYITIPQEIKQIIKTELPAEDCKRKVLLNFDTWMDKRSRQIKILQDLLRVQYFPIRMGEFVSLVTSLFFPLFLGTFFKLYKIKILREDK